MSTPGRPGSPGQAALYLSPHASFPAESFIKPDAWIPYQVTRDPLLAQRLLCLRAGRSLGGITRRKREMTPNEKKDAKYRDKRLKNNEAAKRSREKRKLSDLMREGQLLALSDENARLRARVLSLQYCSGLRASGSQGSVQPPSPFLFQRPMVSMGDGASHQGSLLAVNQQDPCQLGAQFPCFGPKQSVSDPKSTHMYGTQRVFPPPPPGAHSHAAMFGGGRQLDPEQFPVSGNQADTSVRAFLSPPEGPLFPSPLSQGWLTPHRQSLLLPWQPPHLAPPLPHTCPSLSHLDTKLNSAGLWRTIMQLNSPPIIQVQLGTSRWWGGGGEVVVVVACRSRGEKFRSCACESDSVIPSDCRCGKIFMQWKSNRSTDFCRGETGHVTLVLRNYANEKHLEFCS